MCQFCSRHVFDKKQNPVVPCGGHTADSPRLRSRRAGQATVEFAVLLPILLIIALGIAEFARAWMVQQVLTNASREGCRVAVLPETMLQDVQEKVTVYLVSAKLFREAEINATNVGGSAYTGDTTSVTVTYPFRLTIAGFVPGLDSDMMMSKTTVMRHE